MKASIIIPCYNMGKYLEEAVVSALASACDDFEVIVIDDGSTDAGTRGVVDQLEVALSGDVRIRFVRQENQGLSATRNRGIAMATGTYILPLDSDNRLRPDYLPKAIAALESDPSIGVVYAWAQRFEARTDIWAFPPFDPVRILLGNTIDAGSVFRRHVWLDVGGYDEQRFREGYEDWDFWLGVLEKGWKFHLLPEVLYDYRVRPDSMVSACNQPEVRQKLVGNLIEKHKALYAARWPELLIQRELTTLEYERLVAAYHQRYVEALIDFQRHAQEWGDRCARLETTVEKHQSALHRLRYFIGLQDRFDRSWIGRKWAQRRGPARE